jgi:hypothetical protein
VEANASVVRSWKQKRRPEGGGAGRGTITISRDPARSRGGYVR